MSVRALEVVAAGWLLLGATACGPGWSVQQIDCDRILDASDADQLTGVLAEAAPGECVIPASGEYEGTFTIPAGVALAGSERNPPIFLGGTAGTPALILEGGEGSLVANLEITSANGHGLVMLGGPSRAQRVRLSAPRGLALLLRCAEAGCDRERIDLIESEIHDSLNGILISGVNAHLEDNDLHDFDGVSIEAGIGLAMTEGASVESLRDRVTGAGEVAVLVDGAATTSVFEDISVVENRGRGLWAQFLRGSAEVPALRIDGVASEFASNSIVGLGGLDVVGIVVGTCIVRDTTAIALSTDQGPRTEVGDGIGLFGGASEVSIGDGVILRANARAGLLVDQGGTSIVVGTAIVEPGASGFGIVVQRTTNLVELATGLSADDPGALLGVAQEPLRLPGI